MTIEDRVRAATRARGDLVRDIRPLELPVAAPRRVPVRRLMWFAPVTAVAVVAVLAVALVSAHQVRNELPVHRGGPAPAGAVSAVTMPTSPPRYYVALNDSVGNAYSDPPPGLHQAPVDVVAGDILTGKTFATLTPPHGETFVGVTAAADDRTFVVAAASFPLSGGGTSAAPAAWYLLRIAPGTAHPATLTALQITGQPTIDGMALSPEGSELALLAQQNPGEALTIYSVRTGQAVRTWNASGPGGFGEGYWGRISSGSVAWLASGRTLVFDYGSFVGVNGPLGGGWGGVVVGHASIRELDLTRPGSSLLGDSTTVFRPGHGWCDTLQLSSDGTTALCGEQGTNPNKSTANDPEFLAYSLAAGTSRVLYQIRNGPWALGMASVLWASPDGTTLVGSVYERSEYNGVGRDYSHWAVGVITNGRLRPLRIPLHDEPPAAGQISF